MTVSLASGGSVELHLDVELTQLGVEDRRFVFELIDKMNDYTQATEDGGPQEESEEPEWEEAVEGGEASD